MSLFANLMGKIFGHASTPATSAPTQTPPPTAAGINAPTPVPPAPGTGAPVSAAVSSPAPASAAPVDVAAILDGLAAKNSESLDWKKSIVDLMKLVGMDSSLTARKELATELHYSGDMNDSATMNVWLHKAVMQKLAENGGKIPAGLI
jgi:hypothetical protein